MQPESGFQEASRDEVDPTERVIGLSINSDSRVYTLKLMSQNEIVNDTVGGKPVAVTW